MEPISRGHRIRRVAAWIIGVAVLLFGLVYVGISAFTADRLTQPTNHPLPIDPRRLSKDACEWLTRTDDGLTLRGWYLPTEKSATSSCWCTGCGAHGWRWPGWDGTCTSAASTSCSSTCAGTARAIRRGSTWVAANARTSAP